MAKGERTISFYRIVKYKTSAKNEVMAQVKWDEALAALASQPLEKRMSNVAGRILIGEILSYEGHEHLKLLKVRDVEAWLGIYNDKKKSVSDLTLDETTQLYETSIISFLEFGNIVGLIQGSTQAPTISALTEWFSELGIFGPNVELASEAVLSNRAREQLQQAPEASRIETKISTSKAQQLEARHSKLAPLLRRITKDFGPMTVTMILQTSRAKDNTEGRQILRAEAANLAAAADENEVAKAKARLVYIDADEKTTSANVDFLKQRITAKRKIDTIDEEGNAIRNLSAVKAIMQVAAQHDAELREAVASDTVSGDTGKTTTT